MELQFIQSENFWVAEATVNADYNLHIERKSPGSFKIFQRGTAAGKYVDCRGVPDYTFQRDIDHDFQHGVYPKYIRIESGSEVTTATLTEVQS